MINFYQQEVFEVDELLSKIEELKRSDSRFIFRGQPDYIFYLQPKVFREDGIRELEKNFPAKNWGNWLNRGDLNKEVKACFCGSYDVNSSEIRKLFYITVYTMMYNYTLSKCVSKNSKLFSRKTIKLYAEKPENVWCIEETFRRIFIDNLILSVGRVSVSGTVLNYSRFNDCLTVFDECLPQHYSTPTASLDWSDDPYIAIYFALEDIPKTASHMSVYAYRETDQSKELPITIVEGDSGVNNPRLEAQKGIFTKFNHPFSFYFYYNQFPCIENYITDDIENAAQLFKFDVPVHFVDDLRKTISDKGINRDSLLMNEKNDLFKYKINA